MDRRFQESPTADIGPSPELNESTGYGRSVHLTMGHALPHLVADQESGGSFEPLTPPRWWYPGWAALSSANNTPGVRTNSQNRGSSAFSPH